MKKILILLLFALTLGSFSAYAQDDPGRLSSTKIIDALNMLPAQNQGTYNTLMADIESTGDEGISILITKLLANDESRTKVEYALSGYAAYASAESFDAAKRSSLVDAFNKTIEKIGNKDDASSLFLERQLMILGQKKVNVEEEQLQSADVYAALLKNQYKLAATSGNYQDKALLYKILRDYIHSAGVTGAQKTILAALKDQQREYRFACINAVNDYAKDAEIDALFAVIAPSIAKYSDGAKQDLLYWFASYPKAADCDAIVPLLQSKNIDVVASAAWALTRIGNPNYITPVANLIASADKARIDLGVECLKSYKGNVTDAVTALEGLGTDGQVAVISLVAARKDHGKITEVFEALASEDAAVKDAAYAALGSVCTSADLAILYAVLENADTKYVPAVQAGIDNALSTLPSDKRYSTIEARRAAAGDKADLYWPIVFKNADNLTLLGICEELVKGNNDALRAQALQAYISTIPSKATGEQKLIMFRNAMDFARTDAEKNAILEGVGKTGTFLGLMFAGSFIDVPALQQAAAQAVRTNAAADKSFAGPEVKALLEKAKAVITGRDAEYQKTEIQNRLDEMAKDADCGFVKLFNGKDLTGWKGLLAGPNDNPYKRYQLKPEELQKLQAEADELMKKTWFVEDGCIVFSGKGHSLCTEKQYGNFEMYIDWKLYDGPEPDAGIYLRGTPQVQIWDTSRVNVGAQVGSGGLYNNQKNISKPLKVADNGVGQWNSFYIKMVGERVTVYLNGELVVNDVIMENYWDRSLPILMKEQIELQAHGSKVAYRDVYIHELPSVEPSALTAEEKKAGFKMLFDGTSLSEWQGDLVNYSTDAEGNISVSPRSQGTGGNLYTKDEYGDFIFRFEFKLTPGANNGVGIRAEMGKDAAYYGMEIQILDHFDKIYQPDLHDYQYHGSVYGIIPTQDQHQLKPVGEWNTEEIYAKGDYIRVTLNGVVITEGNIREATKNGNYDGKDHPGLFNKKGYIGFLGHGSTLWLRNIRVKSLDK